jgi:hypothetical protein
LGAPPLRALIREEPDSASWGALRFLDQTRGAEAALLVKGYEAALTSSDCNTRARAANRLGDLDANGAAAALEKLSKEPKKRDPFLGVMEQNCGQDEAAAALQKLQKSAAR